MCFEKRADNRVETLCIMPLLLLLLCNFYFLYPKGSSISTSKAQTTARVTQQFSSDKRVKRICTFVKRERENQQDATIRCLLSTLPQHVSGIIMPIFRRTKAVCYCMWCAALVLLDVVGNGCETLRCRVRAL